MSQRVDNYKQEAKVVVLGSGDAARYQKLETVPTLATDICEKSSRDISLKPHILYTLWYQFTHSLIIFLLYLCNGFLCQHHNL